jgi:hypothetical protein
VNDIVDNNSRLTVTIVAMNKGNKRIDSSVKETCVL